MGDEADASAPWVAGGAAVARGGRGAGVGSLAAVLCPGWGNGGRCKIAELNPRVPARSNAVGTVEIGPMQTAVHWDRLRRRRRRDEAEAEEDWESALWPPTLQYVCLEGGAMDLGPRCRSSALRMHACLCLCAVPTCMTLRVCVCVCAVRTRMTLCVLGARV